MTQCDKDWISVEDRLPNDKDKIYVVWFGGDYEFAFWGGQLPFDITGFGWDKENTTSHWLQLPDEPCPTETEPSE